jgi:hypothetical protein
VLRDVLDAQRSLAQALEQPEPDAGKQHLTMNEAAAKAEQIVGASPCNPLENRNFLGEAAEPGAREQPVSQIE